MSVYDYQSLKDHVGHELECVIYGEGTELENVALECLTCSSVMIDFDKNESDYSTDRLQYQESDAWVIIGSPAPQDGLPLFWNIDENDWLEIESATIFDKPMGDMPVGGKEWLTLEQADEVIYNWKLDSSAPF